MVVGDGGGGGGGGGYSIIDSLGLRPKSTS